MSTWPPSRSGAGPGWEQKALPVLSTYFCRYCEQVGRSPALSGPQFLHQSGWCRKVVRHHGMCGQITFEFLTRPFFLPSLMLGAGTGNALSVPLYLRFQAWGIPCASFLWSSVLGGVQASAGLLGL